MQEHPIITFMTGGGLLMALVVYTVKNLLNKIDMLKKKTHQHDVDIAVLKHKIEELSK